MSKKVRIILILIAVLIPIVYVYSEFYRIEHIHNEDGNLLITKADEINNCLNDHADAFNNVADMLISDGTAHDYYYDDELLKDNESFRVLRNQCNVLWIRINPYRNLITFYQTSHIKNNEVALSYIGILESDEKISWRVTKQFPDFKREETFGVKMYNLIFNWGVV
mgnify:CR=1 FL=1